MGRSPIWIKVYAPIWCPSVYRREHLIHVYIAAQMYIIRIRQKRRGYYEMWIHNHFWLLRLFFFPIILKKKNKKNNFRKKFDTYIFRQKTSSSGWLGTLSRFDIDVIERRESSASITTHFRAKPNRASRWSHFQNEIPTPVFLSLLLF
jgi:hypothetical protein